MSLDEFVPGFAPAAAGGFRCFIFQFKKEVLTYEQQSYHHQNAGDSCSRI